MFKVSRSKFKVGCRLLVTGIWQPEIGNSQLSLCLLPPCLSLCASVPLSLSLNILQNGNKA